MARTLGRIFTAGIVWDPQEPLPFEYQNSAFPHFQQEVDDVGPAFPGRVNRMTAPPAHTYALQVIGHGPTPGELAPPHPGLMGHPGIAKPFPTLAVREHDRGVLPPLSISLDVSIVQDTAKVTVSQIFWNDSVRPIKEAAYTFPLPTGCTVTDFNCRIGANKIIKGDVQPKEQARETFQRHIKEHQSGAALLEQDTPEIFTTTLGNIPEKTKIKVTLSYITLLKHHFADALGATTLTIPTYIASRYGSPPEGYNGAESSNVPQGLTLQIEVTESERVRSVVSNTHKITVEKRHGKGKATSFAELAGESPHGDLEVIHVGLESSSAFLDKDFVLDITTEHSCDHEAPQAWLEEHPTLPDHRALMLTLPSQFLGQVSATRQRKSEILFLADRSGSMRRKMQPLISSLHFFLKGIPEGHKFNIWSFGSNYSWWSPQSVEYSAETLEAALTFVDNDFSANMGGTEILPAIQAIVAARDKSMPADIVVLTDGQVWRLDDTLDFIHETRMKTEGRVRFFSLGIGDSVSHALVEGIAKAGGGYAEVIPETVGDGWEDRVVSMLKAALTTEHLGPLHLEFEGNPGLNLSEAQRSPADISTLSPFNHNRAYFLFDNIDGQLDGITVKSVTGSTPDASICIPVRRLEKKDTTIHSLAARSLLEDLERGTSHLHLGLNRARRGTWVESSQVRREAEAIACKWSLVSKWTSFVLVEEPYQPKGDDPFMDSIFEMNDMGGDNLLQPRGDLKLLETLPSFTEAACVTTSEPMVGGVFSPGKLEATTSHGYQQPQRTASGGMKRYSQRVLVRNFKEKSVRRALTSDQDNLLFMPQAAPPPERLISPPPVETSFAAPPTVPNATRPVVISMIETNSSSQLADFEQLDAWKDLSHTTPPSRQGHHRVSECEDRIDLEMGLYLVGVSPPMEMASFRSNSIFDLVTAPQTEHVSAGAGEGKSGAVEVAARAASPNPLDAAADPKEAQERMTRAPPTLSCTVHQGSIRSLGRKVGRDRSSFESPLFPKSTSRPTASNAGATLRLEDVVEEDDERSRRPKPLLRFEIGRAGAAGANRRESRDVQDHHQSDDRSQTAEPIDQPRIWSSRDTNVACLTGTARETTDEDWNNMYVGRQDSLTPTTEDTTSWMNLPSNSALAGESLAAQTSTSSSQSTQPRGFIPRFDDTSIAPLTDNLDESATKSQRRGETWNHYNDPATDVDKHVDLLGGSKASSFGLTPVYCQVPCSPALSTSRSQMEICPTTTPGAKSSSTRGLGDFVREDRGIEEDDADIQVPNMYPKICLDAKNTSFVSSATVARDAKDELPKLPIKQRGLINTTVELDSPREREFGMNSAVLNCKRALIAGHDIDKDGSEPSAEVISISTTPLRAAMDDRSYIRMLLGHQKFDGSFLFSVLEDVLGREISDVATTLKENWAGFSSTWLDTAIVVVLLERDFSSRKSLWTLMHSKAMRYLEKAFPGGEDGSKLQKWLDLVRGKLHGISTTGSSDETDGGWVKVGSGSVYDSAPRELVQRAPCD
ncbi:hypothetical protein OQA88_6671 [Cercophora sp. LCS_1]